MAFTENFRQIEFNPDKEISEDFRATQGDTRSQGFNVVVVLGGKKKVITTETMSFFAQKPDGTRVTDMAVKDGDGFKLELKNQVFAVTGAVLCTLVLRGANGEKLAGRSFKIFVVASMEDGAIVSEDERDILDRAFDLATDIVPRLEGLDVELLENVNNELETKADKDYVDGQDELKADKDYTDLQLALKADKDYTDLQLALKADKTYTDLQLALKADKAEIETARGTEPTLGARLDADKAEVSAELAEKASKEQEEWITPTLQNSFEHRDTRGLKYRKTSRNQLEFKGALIGGIVNTVAFTLPRGYRPAVSRSLNIANVYVDGSMYCEIRDTGLVVIRTVLDSGDFTGIKYFDGVIIPLD